MSDMISRQAAIDVCNYAIDLWHGQLGEGIVIAVRKKIAELPSSQPDLSSYSDKLWRSAYERGKAEAQAEIIRCRDCKYRDPEDKKCDCGHGIVWNLPRQDDWFCADAKRRTDGTEQP